MGLLIHQHSSRPTNLSISARFTSSGFYEMYFKNDSQKVFNKTFVTEISMPSTSFALTLLLSPLKSTKSASSNAFFVANSLQLMCLSTSSLDDPPFKMHLTDRPVVYK